MYKEPDSDRGDNRRRIIRRRFRKLTIVAPRLFTIVLLHFYSYACSSKRDILSEAIRVRRIHNVEERASWYQGKK